MADQVPGGITQCNGYCSQTVRAMASSVRSSCTPSLDQWMVAREHQQAAGGLVTGVSRR